MGERNNEEEETPYDHGDRETDRRGVQGVEALCALKKTSRTGCLARLATSQARKELLNAQQTVKK